MSVFTGERWRILSPYLDQALDLVPKDRARWLAQVRQRQPQLASELAGLLEETEQLRRDGFLEGAAAPLPMLRRALAIRREHFGDRHPSLATSMENLAGSLREQGKYDESQALLEEALALTRDSGRDDDPAIGRLVFTLGRVHLARGDVGQAEGFLREALQRQQASLPDHDWRLAATKSELAAALFHQGQYDDAERLLSEARIVLKDVPGLEGHEAALTQARLAALAEARLAPR